MAMRISQKEKAVFEMEKEGGMKVPGWIFATPSMLEGMKKDRTLWQLGNVAQLEGIIKAAMLMPDGHEGYGFPIGGVAAFDAEDGIVSPGGIGYDINCLPGDTEIIDEFGARRKMGQMSSGAVLQEDGARTLVGLAGINLLVLGSGLQAGYAPYLTKRMEKNGLHSIRTACGKVVRATAEHPILTKDGMKRISDLGEKEGVGVVFFEGVEHENQGNEILVGEEEISEKRRAVLRERGLLPLSMDNPNLPLLAKLIGYLMGDGTVYYSYEKGQVHAFGKKEDLERIKKDFARLGFSARVYERKRRCVITDQYGTKEFDSSSCELHVASSALAELLVRLGMPEGTKTTQDYGVPQWIMKSKKWIKRLFLASFFGAEMSSPATSSKTCFYCATVSQNKHIKNLESGRLFFLQMAEMLKEFGIENVAISTREEFGERHRLRLMISGEEDLLKLWTRVGFEYNEKRRKLAEIACMYILQKKALLAKRDAVGKKVIEYKKKGFKLKELQKMFSCEFANARFIERIYYHGTPPRIPQNAESFREFCERKMPEIERYGVLFDTVQDRSFEQFEGEVYDFNVEEYHNFIANGFVVSNCGVRLLTTPLEEKDVKPKIREICDKLFVNVPSGVGSEGKLRVTPEELDEISRVGIDWAIERGYGRKEDKERTEEHGRMSGADPSVVSPTAKKRGKAQIGTLGAGNHFLEVQVVEKIFDEKSAKAFGLHEGMATVMIHCGSRGFGHQICSDHLETMMGVAKRLHLPMPDRELVYAPLKEKEAQNYLKAMKCAVNYAFCNRHVIMHWARESFDSVFGSGTGEKMRLVYDVAHNIAKEEHHAVDGKKRKLLVHRKGATRAFPKGREELPALYRNVGQPVIIPGSMGTASYVLVGKERSLELSWGSTCHGSGRTMSRHSAIDKHRGQDIAKDLWGRGIYVRATERQTLAEEAPDAYKNVDEVVKSVEEAGLSGIVARLRPLGVVKG